MAWIEKRPLKRGGVSYRVYWRDPAGKVHAKTFNRSEVARTFAREIEHRKDTGSYLDPSAGRITVAEFFERFLDMAPLRPSTKSLYASLARSHLLPALGRYRLNQVTPTEVQDFVVRLSKEGVGDARVSQVHRLLRRVLNQAIRERRIAYNAAVGIQVPKTPKGNVRFLTTAEVNALATEVPPQYRPLILTLAFTGLRIGEAVALRLCDLDLLHERLTVSRSFALVDGKLVKGPTKTGRGRTIRLPAFLAKELGQSLARREDLKPESLVFVTPNGDPIRRDALRSNIFRPAARRAGIDPLPRIHDLRHTAVSFAIQAGMHPKTIQEMVGHSSIVVTFDVYGHVFETLQDEAAERLDAIWRAAEDGTR